MKDELDKLFPQYLKKGYSLDLVCKLPSGKEAHVYIVSSGGNRYVLKVYKDYGTRSFRQDHEYLAGKFSRRRSERKAMSKKSRYGKKLIQRLWVKREFYLLRKLHDSGADVPEPVEMTRNSILMEYVGIGGKPAVLLKDAQISPQKAKEVYDKILSNIDTFYENGIVHGDLSPFNILYSEGDIYIIDFPQAADIRTNPNAEEMLRRDKENVEKWYRKVVELGSI